MTRKISKSRLKKLMDIEWAKIIKARADNRCSICDKYGTNYQIHAHHIAGKKCTTLRWDLRNGIALCANHHNLGNGGPSAHHNAVWFSEWMKANRLDDWEYIKSLETRVESSIPLQWYLDKYEWLKEVKNENL